MAETEHRNRTLGMSVGHRQNRCRYRHRYRKICRRENHPQNRQPSLGSMPPEAEVMVVVVVAAAMDLVGEGGECSGRVAQVARLGEEELLKGVRERFPLC